MCLIVALAILFAGYNFYEHGFVAQAIMSASIASLLIGFFTYRMIKNRRCIFGDKRDCNRDKD